MNGPYYMLYLRTRTVLPSLLTARLTGAFFAPRITTSIVLSGSSTEARRDA